ncbi:MAG TPA: TonB-dependent receptor [Candidatus Omnitrophota bacterium]|nr:TonB-dependent receptor [Candidatus Omnitrophota bacterium]
MKKTLVLFFGLLAVSIQSSICADEDVDLDKIVVTPFNIRTPISKVTKGVTVITREDIKFSRENSLPELIKNKTGIIVTDQISSPKGVKVDMRGFGDSSLSNVLVLIDGRRTNQIDLSGVDWSQISLDSIERIEVVRGSSTVLYGDNAAGGLINIITKKGLTSKPEIKMGMSLGSHQFKKGFTSFGGNSEFADYFINYSHQESNGYRANSEYWDNNIFGKTTLRPSDNLELELSSGYHRDRFGLPGALYPSEIESGGRRGTVYPYDGGFTSDCFVTPVPKLKFSFGEHDINLSLFTSYRERRSKGLTVYTQGVSEYETVHYILADEIRPKLEINSALSGVDNKFVAGIDYFHAKDNILSGNRIGNQQDEADILKDTFGIYLYDLAETWGKFLLNFGGRLEYADYVFDQKGLVANYDSKSIRDGAYDFGIGYEYDKKSQVYFNYGRSYRLPNTEEYYSNKYLWGGIEYGGLNSSLKQQQSHNYELGIRHNAFDWVDFNADIFLMDIKNEIYYDRFSFTNTNYKPQTRHYGLELESKFDLWEGKVQPFMSLTAQESFFKGGPYGKKEIPFVPNVFAAGGVSLSLFKDLKWTISCNYTGPRYAINDLKNEYSELKSFTTFDTTLNYTIKNLEFWCAIKNLFNRNYSEYGIIGSSGKAYYPSDKINFQSGVTLTF